jgi:hypothetical protein
MSTSMRSWLMLSRSDWVVEGTVDQVAADDAEGRLLQHGLLVPHAHVQDDVARLALRLGLEPDAHPAMGLVVGLEVEGGHRVGEHEERRVGAPGGGQALDEEPVLVVEHELQPLLGNIARRLAVDGVAEGHVVGRDRLGDRA